MSYIRGTLTVQTTVKGLDVISCKIGTITGNAASVGSVNCNHCNININVVEEDHQLRTFQNSIIRECGGGTYYNCIWNNDYQPIFGEKYNATKNSCQQVSFTFDTELSTPFTDDSLRTAGYLGNDGTVVGITGGDIPYTLELAAPHVAEHKVEVDNVNRKMTVTLKMAHDANKKEEE